MQRLNIQLSDEVYERIHMLGFQTDTAVTEIIRRCIDTALDGVEMQLVSGRKGKLVMNPDYVLRLTELAKSVERSALTRDTGHNVAPELGTERSLLSGDIQKTAGKEIQLKRTEPTKAELIARIERLEKQVAKEKM